MEETICEKCGGKVRIWEDEDGIHFACLCDSGKDLCLYEAEDDE